MTRDWRTGEETAALGQTVQHQGRKSFGAMTTAEKWAWHAEVYAFRRVVLGVPLDVRTSPCDESGLWFNASLVADAERRMRVKRDGAARSRRGAADARMANDGRLFAEEWAQARGFGDLEAYMLAERITEAEAYMRIVRSVTKAAESAAPKRAGSAAEALGVRAWEPTAEQLRRGRVELGLEASDGGNNA